MLTIGELPGSFPPSVLEIFAALGIAPYLWQFTGSVKRTLAYTVLSAAVALSLSGSLPLFPALSALRACSLRWTRLSCSAEETFFHLPHAPFFPRARSSHRSCASG